jgi:hypothetical protein
VAGVTVQHMFIRLARSDLTVRGCSMKQVRVCCADYPFEGHVVRTDSVARYARVFKPSQEIIADITRTHHNRCYWIETQLFQSDR